MADYWQIKGQAGKSMDATLRDLQEVGAVSARLSFPALATDTFTYSVLLDSLDGTGAILPEDGQTVELHRNGTKFFFGPCKVRQAGYVVQVEVRGAWYWLESLNLTSLQTDTLSNTAERLQYAFPSQSSEISIAALLNRIIALGAPISIGTLATGFVWPEITLNQSNGDIALAELIRLTPDMMAWFDYSGATPSFNTSRRSTATVRTLDVADIDDGGFDIEPVTQMKVEFVRIPFLDRAPNGAQVFREQLSGDAGTAQSGSTSTTLKLRAAASFSTDAYKNLPVSITGGTGNGQTNRTITAYNGATKIATVTPAWTTTPNNTSVYKIGEGLPAGTGSTQVLVVSGEELDTFLPNDLLDSVNIQTSPASGPPNASVTTFIQSKDSYLTGLTSKYGSAGAFGTIGSFSVYGGSWVLGQYTITSSYIPAPGGFTSPVYPHNYISVAGKHVVTAGELPDWFAQTGATIIDANWTLDIGTSVYQFATNGGSNAEALALASEAQRDFFKDSSNFVLSGKPGINSRNDWIIIGARRITLPVKLISVPYPTLTTVYKPSDYGFRFPPAGFASNLQAAQAFMPYTGSLSISEEEAGGTRYRGCVVNVTGALSKFSTMKAMVNGEDIDIDRGATTITLGAPQRLDFRSIVDRVRRTSQDNIVYL